MNLRVIAAFDPTFTSTGLRLTRAGENVGLPEERRSMRRKIASLAGDRRGALVARAGAVAAATVTVQIRSTGFSPGSITINHGDRVTWRNVDKTDHQVVADDGSFASPILHAGQSWTRTLSTAGTFRYHDSLYPRRTGKVAVKGPPPSVTLASRRRSSTTGRRSRSPGRSRPGGEPVGRDRPAAVRAGVVEPARVVKTGAGGIVLVHAHTEPLHDVRRALEQHRERHRGRPGRAEAEARRRAEPAT